MKRIFIAITIISFVSCNSKSGAEFIVEGTVKNSVAKTIYLEHTPENRESPLIIDSAVLDNNGSFKLTATSNEEGLYNLRTAQSPLPFAIFINDSKKIRIDADLAKKTDVYTVSGSKATQSLIDFEKKYGEMSLLMNQSSEHYRTLSSLKPSDSLPLQKIDSLKSLDSLRFETTAKQLKEYGKDVIEKSNSAALTMYVLYFLAPDEQRYVAFTPTEMTEIVTKAANKFPNNTALNNWKKSLRSNKAPEFTLLDTTGKAVSLASFKGKYVLIDFWASWCKPCRMENPNVVAAFNKYKDKNFTILGVSLDNNKQAWLKAIHDDGLTWNHVSDLKGWDSEVAAMYRVQGIPYNFLIDPNGNIVAENIRGQDLFNTLKTVIK